MKQGLLLDICCVISNGNRTEWSPIRSVIIRVINEIGRPRSRSPICLIIIIISITKLEKEKGENVLEKELTTVSQYVKRSVTDP